MAAHLLRRRIISALFVSCLLIAAYSMLSADARDTAEEKKKADALFAERDYFEALAIYEKLAAGDLLPEVRIEVEFEIVRCYVEVVLHRFTNRYVDVAGKALAFIEKNRGTIAEARMYALLSDIYREREHEIWERDGRYVYRKPGKGWKRIDRTKDDRRESRRALDRAVELYLPHVEKAKGLSPSLALKYGRALAHLYTKLVQRHDNEIKGAYIRRYAEAFARGEKEAPVSAEMAFEEEWTPKQKALYYVDRIRKLGELIEDDETRALADYREAVFYAAWYELCDERDYFKWKQDLLPVPEGIDSDAELAAWSKKVEFLPGEDPIAMFREVVKKYPRTSYAPEALFAIATIYENLEETDRREDVYAEIAELYPKSVYALEYREILYYRGQVDLSLPGNLPLANPTKDGRAAFTFESKNVSRVLFEARRIDIRKFVEGHTLDKDYYDTASAAFHARYRGHGFGDILADPEDDPIKWEVDVETDYGRWIKSATSPPLDKGYYLITAAPVEDPDQSYGLLYGISDLLLTAHSSNADFVIRATDTISGRPLEGVKIAARTYVEVTYNTDDVIYDSEGVTDSDGICVFRPDIHPPYVRRRFTVVGEHAENGDVSVFYRVRQGGRGTQPQISAKKAYVRTDRPVYRPGQTVMFKATLRTDDDWDWLIEPEQAVKVGATSGYGYGKDYIFEESYTTDDFGAVSGSFELGERAKLGGYTLKVFAPGASTAIGRAYFDVEEYKRPEYRVTVSAPRPQVKLGEKLTARVKADYYFGEPVAGAAVKYSVRRADANASRPFFIEGERFIMPRKDDGAIIAEEPERGDDDYYAPSEDFDRGRFDSYGEGVTDENGVFEFEIDTSIGQAAHPGYEIEYSVSAVVSDESRRNIYCETTVFATETAFRPFVRLDRYFYREGAEADISITAYTMTGEQVPVSGTVAIYSVRRKLEKGEGAMAEAVEEKTPIGSVPAVIAAGSSARVRWTFDEPGSYYIEFMAVDDWGCEVTEGRYVRVVGEGFGRYGARIAGLEMTTDKNDYEPGDTLEVMLNSRFAGASVVLTAEFENDLLDLRTITLDGNSGTAGIEITKAFRPNFTLHATTVSGGDVYSVTKTICVTEPDKFATVEIRPGKNMYEPGEKGTAEVEVRDRDGAPLAADVNLGVVDSSIYYIHEDQTREPRKTFYSRYATSNWRISSSTDQRINPSTLHDSGFFEFYGFLPSEPLYWPGGYPDAYFNRRFRGYIIIAGFGGDDGEEEEKEAAAKIFAEARKRRDFRETAFFGSKVSEEDGKAVFEFTYPDSLTEWRFTAVAIDRETRVGIARDTAITRKDVIIRFQSPRFLVQKDECVLSGVIHNYLSVEKEVTATIEIDGGAVELLSDAAERIVEVPPGGSVRVDWRVRAAAAGEAVITMQALTDTESDAVVSGFPVLPHGSDRFLGKSGELRDSESVAAVVSVPEERRPEASILEIKLSPTRAAALLETLPYLVDYPYGCLEQTLNRFLPCVIVKDTLGSLGFSAEEVAAAARTKRGGEDGKNIHNLWAEHSRDYDEFLTDEKLDEMIEAGVEKLSSFQKENGGFSWWPDGRVSLYMTVYAVHALTIAREAGVEFDPRILSDAVNFLENVAYPEKEEDEEGAGDEYGDDYDEYEEEYDYFGAYRSKLDLYTRAYILYVLSGAISEVKAQGDLDLEVDKLYNAHLGLTPYYLAMTAISAHRLGRQDLATALADELTSTACVSEDESEAYWATGTSYWDWYEDDIETNAFILQALSLVEPENGLCGLLVNWLMNRRRGLVWKSTKDTAAVIYSVCGYLKATGETAPDLEARIVVDGEEKLAVRVTKENLFSFDDTVRLAGEELTTGDHKIEIFTKGSGALYYQLNLHYYSYECPVPAGAAGFEVSRKYYLLAPGRTVETNEDGEDVERFAFDRVPVPDEGSVTSGDMVEVEITLKTEEDFEYVMLEDMKPAGFESVAIRSGRAYGDVWGNVEVRDTKTAFFVSWLPKGEYKFTYRLFAEVPGTFHGLPCIAKPMYAPQTRGNSGEWRIRLLDRE